MNKNKILNYIREISIFIFTVVNIFPEISTKFLAITSIGIWIIMNLFIDKKKCVDFFVKPNFFMYSIYFWVLSIFLYIALGYDTELRLHFFNYLRLAIIVIVYSYYNKVIGIKSAKNIAYCAVITMAVTNIITIIANYRYYNLSRILSTGMELSFSTLGVGSYMYIYGLIYICIILFSYLIRRLDFKNILTRIKNIKFIFNFLFLILSLYAIYITEFSIAIILLIMGLIISFIDIDKSKKSVIKLIIFISILLLVSIFAKPIVKFIADNTDSKNIQIRAQDIYVFLSEKSLENTVDLKARVDVYTKSIDAFKNNFLLGIKFNNKSGEVGMHSVILDSLGNYGVLGTLPLVLFLSAIYREIFISFKSKWGKKIYGTCLLIFSVFLILNTGLFATIFYFLFCVVPIIIKLIEVEEFKEELVVNENSLDS